MSSLPAQGPQSLSSLKISIKTVSMAIPVKKVIVDLAVPNDTAPGVVENFPVHFIEIESLKEIARKNIQERYG